VASLTVATAQSLITANIADNGQHIRQLMADAKAAGARLVHYPEAALSGYAKAQIRNWSHVDWSAIERELSTIRALAYELELWVVLGCSHRLTAPHRPHNSLYVISPAGTITTRYDKRLCSHTEITDWYSPGTEPVVVDIDGLRFGCALCIEIQFPELFAEYARLDVDCVLLSAYAEDPIFGILAQAHAATNNIWLSLATPAQCAAALPSRFIGPDGHIQACAAGRAEPGITLGRIDHDDARYAIALSKARPWRQAARQGDIYRDRFVIDPRSTDRQSI
tara:strand:+ start:1056 stop:1892 length:837 start_codon:yes stop_codon:yes gene_type:complete